MDYILLIQRSWQIITRHRFLWVFGLVAVLTGQDALWNLRGALRLQPLTEALVNLPLSAANVLRALVPAEAGALLGVAMIVGGLILLAVGCAATAALISLTQAAERGEPIDLRSGVRLGARYAASLVGLRLIFHIPAVSLSIATFLVLSRLVGGQFVLGYSQTLLALQAVGLLPILLLMGLAFGLVVGGIGVGADRGIVLEGLGILPALDYGWHKLRRNIGRYVGVAGLFVSTGLLVVLLIACPLAMLLAERLGELAQAVPVGADLTPLLLSSPLGLLVGAALLALYAFGTAYATIVWTVAYRGFK